MLEVKNTPERTIVNWLEVSVPPVRWGMDMLFFISMPGSEHFIRVVRISDSLRNSVTEDHISNN